MLSAPSDGGNPIFSVCPLFGLVCVRIGAKHYLKLSIRVSGYIFVTELLSHAASRKSEQFHRGLLGFDREFHQQVFIKDGGRFRQDLLLWHRLRLTGTHVRGEHNSTSYIGLLPQWKSSRCE